MIEIIKYSSDYKEDWDNFIDKAKNGTFLFYRDYMEYHSDRFLDYSLLLFENGKLQAIFPANLSNGILFSHQGLTFGSILVMERIDTLKYISYFNEFNIFLYKNNIKSVVYKCIPQIYKSNFGDEEMYVMHRLKGQVVSCNLSSCLSFSNQFKMTRNRKRNYLNSINKGIITQKSTRWSEFWDIMNENLSLRHGVKPVHSIEEILRLHQLFSNRIELLETCLDDDIVAGAVLYKYNRVLKIQYAHANDIGKKSGAIDNLYQYIFKNYSESFDYIDFGTSNTNDGLQINEGLLKQKESFGARGVVFYTYKYHSNCLINNPDGL